MATFNIDLPKTELPPAGEGMRVPYWIEKLWVRLEKQEQRIAMLEKALKDKNED